MRSQADTVTKAMVSKQFCDFTLSSIHFITLISALFLLSILFFCIFSGVLSLWLFLGFLLLLYGICMLFLASEYRCYQDLCFRFAKDTLIGKAEGERSSNEWVFYFAQYGRVADRRRIYAMTDIGDEFLLVVKNNRSNRVLAYYNLKFYKTEEWDG